MTDDAVLVDHAVHDALDAEPQGPAPVNRWRLVRRVLASLVALLAVYFLVNLWLVFRTGNTDQARPVDATGDTTPTGASPGIVPPSPTRPAEPPTGPTPATAPAPTAPALLRPSSAPTNPILRPLSVPGQRP